MIIFRCCDVTTWLVISVLLRTATESSELRGRNYDGSHCVACTIATTLLMQYAQVHNVSVADATEQVCDLLSKHPDYERACRELLAFISPLIIDLLYDEYNADHVCAALNVCPSEDSGKPSCRLFPKFRDKPHHAIEGHIKATKFFATATFPPVCSWPGLKFLCLIARKFTADHLPVEDVDGDGFSDVETLRGSAWRGKDCNDLDPAHHPGARPIHGDVKQDSNCNGIYGVNSDAVPYEEAFCSGSGPRGVMLFGDSAGAHFHIPYQWMSAHLLSEDILEHFPYVLTNEFDWPATSASTGLYNLTWPIVDNITVSIYDRLRTRNRCNHRDYHNIGVNGARAGALLKYFHSIKRNHSTDYPVLAFFEYVGNDVCNTHKDTMSHMTKPDDMRDTVLKTLQQLDDTLPADSHIMLVGLADGRFLWESLHGRYHPLGWLNHDVLYPQIYEFLSCLGVNTCEGWMTPNETLRDLTSARAWQLSQVLKQVASESVGKYKHFDVNYMDCPLTTIFSQWEIEHGAGSAWQLIEPIDGFHPNQLANVLMAEYTWSYLMKHVPHYLGETNPYNQQIIQIFGDQGGY